MRKNSSVIRVVLALCAIAAPTTVLAQSAKAFDLTFTSAKNGQFDVFTVGVDSSGARADNPVSIASAGPGSEARGPDWSISDRIAYQSGRSGARAIHLVRADGTGNVRLTKPPSEGGCRDARDPSWSHDGRFIAYACLASNQTQYDIWIHDTNGSLDDPTNDLDYSLSINLPNTTKLRPSWSPDDSKVAFVAGSQIGVVTVGGSSQLRAVGAPVLLTNSFINFDPTWSPDGQQIAYSTTRNGGRDIYRMSATAGELDPNQPATLLTRREGDNTNPSWSPDGTMVAFVSDRTGNREIYITSASEGEASEVATQVTDDSAEDNDPAWKQCDLEDTDCDGIENDIDGTQLDGSFRPEADYPSFGASDNVTSVLVFDSRWLTRSFFFEAANSNNFGVRSAGSQIDSVVIHHCGESATNPGFFSGCRSHFEDAASKVSAHYVVSHNGEVVHMVDDNQRAFHATYYNNRSVGIELEGYGRRADFTNRLYETASTVVARLLTENPSILSRLLELNLPLHPTDVAGVADDKIETCLDVPGIVGHEQIQPKAGIPNCQTKAVDKKSDPGPAFEWDAFTSHVTDNYAELPKSPSVRVQKALDPDDGLLIETLSGNGAMARVVPTCSSIAAPAALVDAVIYLSGRQSVTVKCGSLTVRVISGPITVVLPMQTSVTVASGSQVQMEEVADGYIEIRHLTGVENLVVNAGGQQFDIPSSGSVMVATQSANKPPVADAGPDQYVTLGSEVVLHGSSVDPDSAIAAYSWVQESGPAVVLRDSETASSRFNPTEPGLYQFSLVASDGFDVSLPDLVNINVTAGANHAPVVNAGPDQSVFIPNSATLNGTVNDDGLPSGILTMQWTQVNGPGSATFGSPTAPVTTVSFSDVGTYVLRLKADDGESAASDEVSIIVKPADGSGTQPRSLLVAVTAEDSLWRYSEAAAFLDRFVAPGPAPYQDSQIAMTVGPDHNIYKVGSGGSQNVVRVFSGSTGAYIKDLFPPGIGGLVSGAAGIVFGPDGKLYVSAQETVKCSIKRYDGTTGAYLGELDANPTCTEWAQELTIGPDGLLYAGWSGPQGVYVKRYDVMTGTSLGNFTAPGAAGTGGFVSDIAFGDDSVLYVADFGGQAVHRFNATTGAFLGNIAATWPSGMVLGPNHDLYVSLRYGASVARYDRTTGAFLGTFVAGITEPTRLMWLVPASNTPPKPNPGGPYTFCLNRPDLTLSLDGRGSFDSDGSIVNYEWDWSSPLNFTPPDAKGAFVNATAVFSSIPAGTYDIGLRVTDNDASQNTDLTTVTVFSAADCPIPAPNLPPVVTVPSDITAEATSAAGASVSFTVTATDPEQGPLTAACTSTSGATFTLGLTVVTCSATDDKGLSDSKSFTIAVVDTTAPVVIGTTVTAEATGPNGATATYSASASDIVDGAIAPACAPPSGGVFAVGFTTVTCSATDAHGNTGHVTLTVSVVDTTSPMITTAGSTVEATSAAGAIASYTVAATDIVDISVTISCDEPSGIVFPIGATTVHCTATDDAGNTSSAAAIVTVRDTTAPVFTVNPIAVTTTGINVVVTYLFTATDAVDMTDTVVCVPASGSSFPLGTTTVDCTSTDAHGNAGSHSFTVTVTRTVPQNQPPLCSAAAPSVTMLWPPNHKFVPIKILGVTDPNGDMVTIRITSIFQDEPTNGGGDSETAIDGAGINTDTAYVRAERSGNGNGRVYHVRFTATDPQGAWCSGEVTVGVPHDPAHPAKDGGPKYDSTKKGRPIDNDEHHGCGDKDDHDRARGRTKKQHDRTYHGWGKDMDDDDHNRGGHSDNDEDYDRGRR